MAVDDAIHGDVVTERDLAKADASRERGFAASAWRRMVRRALRDVQADIVEVESRYRRDTEDLTLAGELNALRRVRDRWNERLAAEDAEDRP